MALLTGGTDATSTLSALLVSRNMATADIASFALAIKNDQINGNPIWPGAWAQSGLLYVPNRGVLQTLPGDYVMFDPTTGWPILVSALAMAGGDWNHS